MNNDTKHFGYQTVQTEKKQSLVREVFASVAPRYDLMNDVMSGGLHRLWKESMVRDLAPRSQSHLLDVAGGTGDVAFRVLDAQSTMQVTICDINEAMLQEGKKRAIDKGLLSPMLTWGCGNAESLPFPDQSFDYYTIAFGIRNVTHIDKALAEAYRVLKPGGRFLCLEFSHVSLPLLKQCYDFYSFRIIPALGQYIAKDRDSYQYLVESIRMFPQQSEFATMMENAGFVRASYRNMTGGVVALHSGWRI